MELAADIISWPLLVAGVLFSIIGGIGLVRMPDLFSRMHAASVVDTLGIALIAIGLMVQAGPTLVTVKLIIIVVFVFLTSPTSTHALAKAAIHGAVRPLVDRDAEDPNQVDEKTEKDSERADKDDEPEKDEKPEEDAKAEKDDKSEKGEKSEKDDRPEKKEPKP